MGFLNQAHIHLEGESYTSPIRGDDAPLSHAIRRRSTTQAVALCIYTKSVIVNYRGLWQQASYNPSYGTGGCPSKNSHHTHHTHNTHSSTTQCYKPVPT
jgi:hypothetical protein